MSPTPPSFFSLHSLFFQFVEGESRKHHKSESPNLQCFHTLHLIICLYFVYQLVCFPDCLYVRWYNVITAFCCGDKVIYFLEIALRIYLIVRQYGDEIVSLTKDFFCFMMGMQFLPWDAEDGGVSRCKGKFLHLREMIDA